MEQIIGGIIAAVGVAWGYWSAKQPKAGERESGKAGPILPPHPLFFLLALPLSRFLALGLLLALSATGCAYNRPSLTETITGTNGIITTRTLTMRSYVVWPATSALEKQKATIGKTMGVGTEGLGQEGGGTNVVEALRAIDSILGKLRTP